MPSVEAIKDLEACCRVVCVEQQEEGEWKNIIMGERKGKWGILREKGRGQRGIKLKGEGRALSYRW